MRSGAREARQAQERDSEARKTRRQSGARDAQGGARGPRGHKEAQHKEAQGGTRKPGSAQRGASEARRPRIEQNS